MTDWPTAIPLHVCDVSGWQDPDLVAWNAAHQGGLAMAIVKRNQGRGKTESGDHHAANIHNTPVVRADYSFADTRRKRDRLHPTAQAETFCQAVGEIGPDDGTPFLDLEWHKFKTAEEKGAYYDSFTQRDQTEWALEWLDYVETRLGVRPGIYTLKSFARHRLDAKCAELAKSPLWLANVPGRKLSPKVVPDASDGLGRKAPPPWDDWVLYQWTSRGKVPWYRSGKGAIDRNVPRHGIETLESLIVGSAPEQPSAYEALVQAHEAMGAAIERLGEERR
jgi:GH25 family lysozyme M1 (1,4-beta-N-acetylmuramidase)